MGQSKTDIFLKTALELDPNAAEAKNGMNRVMTAKYASRNDPEATRQRAMNDPEVQQIMGDPSMRMILEQVRKMKNLKIKIDLKNWKFWKWN